MTDRVAVFPARPVSMLEQKPRGNPDDKWYGRDWSKINIDQFHLVENGIRRKWKIYVFEKIQHP